MASTSFAKQFTTCPDGTSISTGTELIRKSDGCRFKVERISKEAGKGRYGRIAIVIRHRTETFTLARQDLQDFEVNRGTVREGRWVDNEDPGEDWISQYSW